MTARWRVRVFEPADEQAVVALWHACGLVRPWNDPHKDIARKRDFQPELFLVGVLDVDGREVLVATAMAGYDGHRGSVYYLAISPEHQRASLGRALMDEIERRLCALGCPKINILVRTGNAPVLRFYEKLGYVRDDAYSIGKRLISDL